MHNEEHKKSGATKKNPSSWCQQDAASTPRRRRLPPPPLPRDNDDDNDNNNSNNGLPTSAPNTSGDPRSTTMHPSNEVPFLCLSALFMLVSSLNACQHFYAYQYFLCLSATKIIQSMLIRVCRKLKIEFTQNNLLFQSDLSGLSFGSRQNTKCLVLD